MHSSKNKTKDKTFREKVLGVVSGIPRGQVMSYRDVAVCAGNPWAARAVGNIMSHYNGQFDDSYGECGLVPCHRVICSDGRIGGFGDGVSEKRALLESEGVLVRDGKIVF